MSFTLSKHAITRARQRGFRQEVIDLVLAHGSETDRGIFFGDREADDMIAQYKRAIHIVENARNTLLGIKRGTVATGFRPRHRRDRGQRL